ncbi:MAG: transposase [Kiritimatiellia bacterium]
MKMVILIRALFHLERRADELQMNADERLALRLEHAVPVVAEIRERLDVEEADGVLPRSVGQGRDLRRQPSEAADSFLKDGRVPIHNSRAERRCSDLAIGRKNWLFFGAASRRTCGGHPAQPGRDLRALLGEPEAYFDDILRRIMDHDQTRLGELLPDQWQAAHTAKAAAVVSA